jgi:hypothetical protein
MRVRFWSAVAIILLTAGLACAAGTDFGGLDRDKNGILEKAEMEKGVPEAFKGADSNGDGVLDESEYKAAGGDPAQFKKVDRDASGRIDLDEFREAASKRFDQIDRNHDGRIDTGELSRRQKPIVNPLLILYF